MEKMAKTSNEQDWAIVEEKKKIIIVLKWQWDGNVHTEHYVAAL